MRYSIVFLAVLTLSATLLWLPTAEIARAQIVEDTEPPKIVGRPIINAPQDRAAYRAGEAISVTLTFNEPVQVTGKPRLRLAIGDARRWAKYDGASNDSKSLTFSYQVKSDDRDDDGVSVRKNSLRLNGGSITDANGNAAKLKHKRLSGLANHKVNGRGALSGEPQTSAAPSAPTNVLAEPIGDLEVRVSWDAQTTACPSPGTAVTRYSLRLYDLSDDSIVIGFSVRNATEYTVTQLEAGRNYEAEVRAIGCSLWSDPTYHKFTTDSAGDGQADDPIKPSGEPKMPPNPPTGLTVTKSTTDGEATVSWDEADADTTRCPRAFYVMYFGGVNDPDFNTLTKRGISETMTTVTGLTDDKQYHVYVASYSTECDSYSPAARTNYTHQ